MIFSISAEITILQAHDVCAAFLSGSLSSPIRTKVCVSLYAYQPQEPICLLQFQMRMQHLSNTPTNAHI